LEGISPHDSNLVIAGSSKSGGVYRTADGGAIWTNSSTGVLANSALGFTQNPSNGQELLLSSTVGYGWGRSYHSLNGGTTWTVIPEVSAADGVLSWDKDPANAQNIIAGRLFAGIYRSTNGPNGPWTHVLNKNIRIARIYRDSVNTNIVYGVAVDGQHDSSGNMLNPNEVRLYYSNDNGANFTIRPLIYTGALAIHPTQSNEGIAVSNDAYSTIDGFQSRNSLGLTSQATAEGGLMTATFHFNQNNYVLVGGKSGGIYRTTNYDSVGTSVNWESVNSPVVGTPIRDLVIRNENAKTIYYLTTMTVDVDFTPTQKAGLFRSADEGETWTELSSDLRPCTSFLSFSPQIGSTTKFWAGLWGGGLFQLAIQ
jgi:hypothetical protein